MESFLDDFQKPKFLSDKELFTKIWTKPREAFEYIHETKHDTYVKALIILSGILGALDNAETRNLGADHSVLYIIGISIVVGLFLGWISYYIYAGLLSWTGRWLHGEGDMQSILRVIAYSQVPYVFVIFFMIPQMLIMGEEMFIADSVLISDHFIGELIFYGALLWEFVLVIYSLVLSVVGISVVQNFGIGKAILNLFLPILIIGIPIALLVIAALSM